jgi:hypothetical protein
MSDLLERAINGDNGDRFAKIIQEALVGACGPEDRWH